MQKKELLEHITIKLRELWRVCDDQEKKEIQTFAKKLRTFSSEKYIDKDIQQIQETLKQWANESHNKFEEEVKSIFLFGKNGD